MGGPRLFLGQADMGQLGVGEGDAGNLVGARPDGQAKQRVTDRQPGMVVGQMGELHAASRIADRMDPAVRHAAQSLADLHARARRLHARSPQIEPPEVGLPARRNEQDRTVEHA